MSEPIEYTDQYDLGTLTLLAAPDKDGHAEGWLYEDAGDGFAFEKGVYALTHFKIRQAGQKV